MWRVVECNTFDKHGVKLKTVFKIYDREKNLMCAEPPCTFASKERAEQMLVHLNRLDEK